MDERLVLARPTILVIACGALAREIAALKRANGWSTLEVRCLPAELHNRPERIAPAVRAVIEESRGRYASMFVAYADCGTRGALDAVLKEEGIERLPGAHCYEFFATAPVFAQLAEAEPGTFYLTDFLLRHYERLVVRALGLDRHPELAGEYFRNYRRLVYLSQAARPDAVEQARRIADSLGFEFEHRVTGYGVLGTRLATLVAGQDTLAWPA
ncbi:MAG TPA: DUF1638 domain-containing protein [Steroidobacteraceae bacterium]|jgi:hypothetical protein|nr:DUF1638 domain-containing protein [Steroidobacteraceae bacterium]